MTIHRLLPAGARGVGFLLVLLPTLLLGACQGGLASLVTLPPETDALAELGEIDIPVEPPPEAVFEPPDARIERGAYEGDPRVKPLFDTWPTIVGDATRTLAQATGLVFPDGVAARVVLEALGDERKRYALSSDVDGGRRVPVVRLNLERLATGAESADVLLRVALAEAVYEETGRRFGAVDPWVVEAARLAAAGDLEERLVEAALDSADESDLAKTRHRGLGALVLLLEAGNPAHMQRFFRFTSEGDDPDSYLARLVQDPAGSWEGVARVRTKRRMARVDTSPEQILRAARSAFEETGRAGLESALPTRIPPRVRPAAELLRARAAAAEGDYAAARDIFRALPPTAWAAEPDAGEAMALWIRAEQKEGGDRARATLLDERFRRDFPRASRHTTRVEREWTVVDAATELRALLDDHRAGGARRAIPALGPRAAAPELEALRLEVARAEENPSPAAVEANRRRVRAWLARPTPKTREDVVDGGTAAAVPLAEALQRNRLRRREDGVRLLVETAEAGRVVQLLSPSWRGNPRRLRRDLDVLLERIPYPALRLWVEGTAGEALQGLDAEKVWSAVRFGLSPAFLEVDPQVLAELRSSEFSVRMAAFQRIVKGEQATPEIVGHALEDPAMLMRRAAARIAAERGYRSLLGVALQDEAWAVRQAAVPGIVGLYGGGAQSMLITRAAKDPSPEVRMASLIALLSASGPRAVTADACVRALEDPHGGVRRTASRALGGLEPRDALPAIHRGLAREAARTTPSPATLARLFLLFHRLSGWDARYDGTMTCAEVQTLVEKAGQVARRVEAATRTGS